MCIQYFIGIELIEDANFDILSSPAQLPLASRIGIATGYRGGEIGIGCGMGVDKTVISAIGLFFLP